MKKWLIAIILGITMVLANATVFGAPRPTAKEVTAYANTFEGSIGIYAKNLKTGKTYAYRPDVVFPTASTSKLVVAVAAYKYLYPAADADARTVYDDDIEKMITVSDNEAFYNLLNEFEEKMPAALARTLKDLRLKKTMIHDDRAFQRYNYHSVTTPKEMATVMETIYRKKYLGKRTSEQLLDALGRTIFTEEIPRYMLTPVMHKVGELDDVLCDVGIVDDGKNRILISVYTSSPASADSKSDYIANIAAKVYNLLRE
ncbi:serine hydrolase [Sporolituus thermophilus]|uniref:Beta-lactamase class A n=1 Tax=Sporolituus thermophilus DSM 23256 TaxID=1123285 RepID=A0A1G7MXN1_9FIRM|nr:serine hydrolase [Sporolituus thermophilus]SDF66416.1 beta-lactamase class A [Sporolituus thermophilus DSM 23256]